MASLPMSFEAWLMGQGRAFRRAHRSKAAQARLRKALGSRVY